MAVITQLNQDDQNQQNQQNGQPSGANPITPVGGSQSANISSTGQASTGTGSATVANNTPASSGNFTNLQNYLNANKGSGAQIATKIGQNVQQSADQTNKDVAATGTIQSQLDAEKNRLAQTSGFVNQIGTDPTQLANNNNTLNAVTQLRTGTNAADSINSNAQTKLNTAQNDLTSLQQNAANTATENGRFQLLQQTLGRPTYNQGQQSLDNLLVQNGGQGVLDNLQKTAQTTAANATNTLGQTSAQLSTGVNDVKSQAAADQTAINGAIGTLDNAGTTAYDGTGALGSLQQSLQQKQQDYINQQNALGAAYQSGYSTDQYSPAVLQALGLTAGQNLYNTDLNNYVTPMTVDNNNVSEQNVASQSDLARYNALAQLAGTDPSYLTSSQIGQQTGAFSPTQVAALSTGLGNAKTQYSQDVQNLFNAAPSDQYLSDHYDTNGNPIGTQYSYSPTLSTAAQGSLTNLNQYSDPSNVFGQNDTAWKTALQNLLNMQGDRRVGAIDPESATAVNDNTFGVT